MLRTAFLLLFALLLGGCASAPFSTAGLDPTLTPSRAVKESRFVQGREVVWGGVIVSSTNLADATRFEILAYPLDRSQRPETDQAPYGRFLLYKPGYAETVDYAPGREVTVRGRLDGIQQGRVGEAPYTYPLVRSNTLHLWPAGGRSESRVHFGVGVIFGR
jgi:outer membrane lipoprotein